MRIIRKEIKDSILNMELLIDKEEFNEARRKAYLDHPDRYPITDVVPGSATLTILEWNYGPAVLFDEALENAIPEAFSKVLVQENLRIVDNPELGDIHFVPGGGVSFVAKANLYPKVELGQYKEIAVPYSRLEQQKEFEHAVLQKACENMKCEIPTHMIEKKLDAITDKAKNRINNDPVYKLLADMVEVLDEAYKAVGAVRPKKQVHQEATELMLKTVSAEHEKDWGEFFGGLVKAMVKRCHDIPEGFDQKLKEIITNRSVKRHEMSPEEMADDLFVAFLGSMGLTADQWRDQNQPQAAKEVYMDLMLDAVAEKEMLGASEEEMHHYLEELAELHAVKPEELEAKISKESMIWMLKHDKALTLILDSARTDEEDKKKLDEERV